MEPDRPHLIPRARTIPNDAVAIKLPLGCVLDARRDVVAGGVSQQGAVLEEARRIAPRVGRVGLLDEADREAFGISRRGEEATEGPATPPPVAEPESFRLCVSV